MRRHFEYIAIPERATCRRCATPFNYSRTTKPRSYCDPCTVLEKQDTNDFVNAKARQKRLAARMSAWLIHREFADA